MAQPTKPMKEEDLQAFEPIEFPEIGPGVKFNANFCRNPMCPNFGPAPDRGSYARRYEVEPVRGFLADRRYVCRICGMRSRLLSNRSLRAAYVWFKSQSIPYDACRNEACGQYGVNVFEHSGCYESQARDRARCQECNRTFTLDSAKGLHRSLDEPGRLERRLEDVFWHTYQGMGFRKGLREFEQRFRDARGDNPSHYLALRRNVGFRVRDYQNHSGAALMAQDCLERLHRLFPREDGSEEPGPEDSPFNGTATLRTDTVYGSLQKRTSAYRPRSCQLPVLVTALRLHKPPGMFVLAAHPCAVFGDLLPEDPAQAMTDGGLPVAERRFDHLYHFGTDHGETALRANRYSYLSAQALFMREEYAELAHFMVLRELTARFDRVTLSLDGKHTAYRSAAAVFAGDMRTPVAAKKRDGGGEKGDGGGEEKRDVRRAEIAVVQIQTRDAAKKSVGTPMPEWESETERVAAAWRDGIGAELEKDGLDLLGDRDTQRRDRAKAELFVKAMHGGWSERGSWAWRERKGRDERRLAVLWLSQGPDRDWPPCEEVEAFLALASPQSVDTAIGALRERAQALIRPGTRAEQGLSFNKSMVSAEHASFQIWVARFTLNYARARDNLIRGKQPAHWLGLLPWEEVDAMRVGGDLDFLPGWREAREMTRRLGNG